MKKEGFSKISTDPSRLDARSEEVFFAELSFLKESGCGLCPRECGADRLTGEKGYCRADGRLFAARAALHFWEEPCLSGERGSGTIFFSGCNLRCVYCQNREISRGKSGKEITPQNLSEIFLRLQEQGAHNINLVTPTHYLPWILQALDTARAKGLSLPVVYNTGGYEKPETIRRLSGYVDVYLPDMKYFSPTLSARYSAAPDYFAYASASLAEMVRQVREPVFGLDGMMQKGVIVRHLILPEHIDDSKRIVRYLYETYGDTIYLSLMNQYTPMEKFPEYPELSRRLTEAEYDEVVDYAIALGVENGFIQEMCIRDSRSRSPFCRRT